MSAAESAAWGQGWGVERLVSRALQRHPRTRAPTHLIHVDALRAQHLARLVRLHLELRGRGSRRAAGACVKTCARRARSARLLWCRKERACTRALLRFRATHLIARVLDELAGKVLAKVLCRLLDALDRLRRGGGGNMGDRVRARVRAGCGPPARGAPGHDKARKTHAAEAEAIVLVAQVRLGRRELVHLKLDLRARDGCDGRGALGMSGARPRAGRGRLSSVGRGRGGEDALLRRHGIEKEPCRVRPMPTRCTRQARAR